MVHYLMVGIVSYLIGATLIPPLLVDEYRHRLIEGVAVFALIPMVLLLLPVELCARQIIAVIRALARSKVRLPVPILISMMFCGAMCCVGGLFAAALTFMAARPAAALGLLVALVAWIFCIAGVLMMALAVWISFGPELSAASQHAAEQGDFSAH
jgi:hypothetical protein